MIWTVLQVALGGAIGSATRFLAGVAIYRVHPAPAFPLAILFVNILGSFLMGFAVVYLAKAGLTRLNPFFMTGLLGGFTTFSAFSLEAMTLYERGEIGLAILYVALSVILSLGALALGLTAARGAFA